MEVKSRIGGMLPALFSHVFVIAECFNTGRGNQIGKWASFLHSGASLSSASLSYFQQC